MISNEKVGDLVNTKEQIDSKREETLEAIRKLCLLDDNLMTLVFDRNIEATELLLNVILQRDDLKVLEVVAQREYKNPMLHPLLQGWDGTFSVLLQNLSSLSSSFISPARYRLPAI